MSSGTGRRLAMSLVILASSVLALPSVAKADSIDDKRAEAAAIAARIDELDGVVEREGEAANAAQIELDDINRQAAEAQARADATQAQVAGHRGELRDYAVVAYVKGADGSSSASPDETDPATLTVAHGYLSAASGNRQQLIDQLRSSEHDLQVQLTGLDADRASAEAKAKQQADRKAAAEGAVAEQQALYKKAQGELATLVKEEQDRRATEQAAAARQRAQQAASSGRAPKATPAPSTSANDPGPAPSPNGNVNAVIARAKAQLGKPYQWGAAGPDSFDCSGLTMYAWQAAGVYLPHYTKSQYEATRHISIDQLQPGDLVFFNNFEHMNMYIGNGQVIDSPHTGAYVHIVDLYWAGQPQYASRPG